jgi:tRNA threonylcarbamoyladenosine biosynthesis protein TsaB
MDLILLIDVSGNEGFVSLAADGDIIETATNNEPMNHAAFLQPAIKGLLERNGYATSDLTAIAVSNGPGSYTGLRVGLASAKGLAFALSIPLITVNTLQMKALALINTHSNIVIDDNTLVCPMIDARRMEVYFGLYNSMGETLVSPAAAVIDEFFLAGFLKHHRIIFSGSGMNKWQNISRNENAFFITESLPDKALAGYAFGLLQQNLIADLPGAEPFYCKEFYQPLPVG